MTLTELVFREVNLVLVHGGVPIPAISLDRVRAARPAGAMQVTSAPMGLTILYPEERLVVQFDPQRLTCTENSGRPPEGCRIVEAALAQHQAVGSPSVAAFGFNIRFDFAVAGMEAPSARLMSGLIRNPDAISSALHADTFQAGFNLLFRRGMKLWSLRLDPVVNAPQRLAVMANVHEDLGTPPPPDAESTGMPAPAWMQEGALAHLGAGLPGMESLKADLALAGRTSLETVVRLLELGG